MFSLDVLEILYMLQLNLNTVVRGLMMLIEKSLVSKSSFKIAVYYLSPAHEDIRLPLNFKEPSLNDSN